MHTLDLETAGQTFGDHFALEPWRARHGTARITSISVYNDSNECYHNEAPTRDVLVDQLERLAGQEVYAHNSIFDIAWLIASIQPDKYGKIPDCIKNIRWRDSMLLAKWVVNSQKADLAHYSFSLANLVGDALRDDPDVQKFLKFKSLGHVTADSEYWSERGKLDVLWTHKLVRKIESRLADSQRMGYAIEARCLVPVANSWITGLRIDKARLLRLDDELNADNARIAKASGLNPSMASSPKQLAQKVFVEMGLRPIKKTPTGAPSTDEESLKTLSYQLKQSNDPRQHVLDHIMALKYNATVRSKYVKATLQALERTGDGYVYPIPKVFGTGSGRFTYSNQTVPGVKVSLAAHQMPRTEKRVREAVVAPDGMMISEWDAAGQESRIMAIQSQDPVMIDIFQSGKNFHSMTGCGIVGMAYAPFQALVDKEDPQTIEYRQLGKLANLSCNFRIGGPALANQAFNKYDMVMAISTGFTLVNTFKNTYRGVPEYWDRAIGKAKHDGYATTFADRRYHIGDWSKVWPAEQTAISHPIQGSGADHKLIAIATAYNDVPEAQFLLDLHDGLFFIVPDEATHIRLGAALNQIKYNSFWPMMNINIPLPFDGKFGRTFKDVK